MVTIKTIEEEAYLHLEGKDELIAEVNELHYTLESLDSRFRKYIEKTDRDFYQILTILKKIKKQGDINGKKFNTDTSRGFSSNISKTTQYGSRTTPNSYYGKETPRI